MGAGIDDAVLRLHEIDAAVLVEVQLKLQHLHARELAILPQLLHLVGNHAQVLCHNRHIADCLPHQVKERLARARTPCTINSCLGITINLPEGLKAPEMVNAHDIHLLQDILETANPPVIAILLHNLPIILRVAPELACLAEIIRRYTGNLVRPAVLVQLEQLLMRPGIGTILGNKNRHISHDLDALVIGVLLQCLPLLVEDVLLEHYLPNLVGKLFLHGIQCHLVPADEFGIPFIPALAIVPVLQCLEHGIIPKPVLIGIHEFLEILPVFLGTGIKEIDIGLEHQGRLQHLRPGIIRLAIIHDRSILQIHLGQKPLICQHLQRNKQRIASKGRRRSIRRAACSHRVQRQYLPNLLPGLSQKVHELVRLRPQVTDTKRRWQGSRMQQHTALACPFGKSRCRRLVLIYKAGISRDINLQPAPHNPDIRPVTKGIHHDACRQVPHIQGSMPWLAAAVNKDNKYLIFRLHAKDILLLINHTGIAVYISLGIDRQDAACLQCRMLVAQMDELSGPLPELRIAVFPVIGASAIRVAVALQTDFITIINTRHSREGHLPQNSRLETLNTLVKPWPIQLVLCLTDSRYTFLARGLTQQGKNTLPVMTAQQIHHDIEILLWIILHQALEPLGNLSCISISQQKVQHYLPERIIHGRIQLLAAEVFTGYTVSTLVGSILPYLAQHNCILIHFLENLVEGLGEFLRQLVHHIKAPAADTLLHPVFQHAVLIFDDELHIGRIFFLDIWQSAEAPPAFIAVRIIIEAVPVIIRRLLGLIGSQRIIVAIFIEITAVIACMAEHAIQHNADAHFFCISTELLQLLIGAQDRVYLVVVTSIIVMVAGRLKNRVQVNNRYAQILEVAQLLPDTCQIAPEEVVCNDFPGIRVLVVAWLVVPAGMIYSTLLLHQGIALAIKAVRENLIHDRVLEPVRRLCPLVKYRYLVGLGWRIVGQNSHPAHALIVIAVVPGSAIHGNNKIIPEKAAPLRHGNMGGIIHLAAHRVLRQKLIDHLAYPLTPEPCLDLDRWLDIAQLRKLQLQAQPNTGSCLCRSHRTAIKFILRIVFYMF